MVKVCTVKRLLNFLLIILFIQFLGDAVLVSFQANTFEDEEVFGDDNIHEKMARQKNLLVRRAVECGLQLLARLSHYRVYLTAEERTKHKSSETGEIDRRVKPERNQRFYLFDGGGNGSTNSQRSSSSRDSLRLGSSENLDPSYAEEYSTSFNFWNCIPLMFGKERKNKVYATRRASDTSETIKETVDSIDLELHIALSCGNITNVILGDMNNTAAVPTSPTTAKKQQRFSYVSSNGNEDVVDYNVEYNGRLEYAICGPAVESLEDALDAAKAGEMSITPEAYDLFQNQAMMNLSFEKRKQFYVVTSSDIGDQRKSIRPVNGKGYSSPNASYLANRPGLMTRAATLNIEPLIPRTRDTSYLEFSTDPNPHYFKYINRSALYRLKHSPDDNFPAQFRDATIMFISLGKLNVATPEGIQIAQRATMATIQILVKYEG